MWWMATVIGCVGGEAPSEPEPDVPPTSPDTLIAPATGTTGETGLVQSVPFVDPDCVDLPPPGPFSFEALDIQTEEDFDFDLNGYLVAQHITDLVGYTRAGDRRIIATGTDDPAGIRALQTGDYVIVYPGSGTVRLVNGQTGGSQVALGGLTYPNGLEVGADGLVYVTEFLGQGRVRTLDPYSGDQALVLDSNANGIALNPTEDRLYLSTILAITGFGAGRLGVLERDEAGAWSPTLLPLMESNSLIEGLTTDKCGNLYGLESYTGRVFRIRAADSVVELIADLQQPGTYSSARFGNGIGDWPRTTLHVTNRNRIFAIDVGIEGRHVLAPAAR